MSKLKLALIGLVIVFSLSFSAFVALGPFFTLYGIQYSVKQDRIVLLNFLVDFPAVQSSVKKQIKQNIEREYQINLSESSNPFEKFAKQFFENMLQISVETAVSPAGIKTLLLGGELSGLLKKQDIEPKQMSDPSFTGYMQYLGKNQFSYQSHEQFEFRLMNADTGTQSTRLVLKRYGIIWKLVDVELNQNQ